MACARSLTVGPPHRPSPLRRGAGLAAPPHRGLDRIAAMAARRFDAPIAVVSLVGEDRVWFASQEEAERDPDLFGPAKRFRPVDDANTDLRALADPSVAAEFCLHFYAAVSLINADGLDLGTLCVLDRRARPVDQGQIDDLEDLAGVIVNMVALQRADRDASARGTHVQGN